jgi:Ca2+-binding EF-hand superfamily protein
MKKTLLTSIFLLIVASPLAAQQQGNASAGQMFLQQFDTNKDGSVDLEEFLAPQKAQFKHIDKDGDGKITEAEADAFVKEMQAHLQKMRQQAPKQ